MKRVLLSALLLGTACQQNDFSRILYPETSDLRFAQTAYCYEALTDIICYNNPQPQLSNPVKGVQMAADSRISDPRKTKMEQISEQVYYNLYGKDPRQSPQPLPSANRMANAEIVIEQEPMVVTAPSDPITVKPLVPVVQTNADEPLPLLGTQ